MADNTKLPLGTLDGDTYASDDIGSVKFQRVKLTLGADGTNDGDVSSTNPIPVSGTITATGGLTDTQLRASAVPVSLASVPSHAVTNAGTFAVQASIAAAQTLSTVTTVGTVSTITNVVHVDDNGGSLTVDGTVTATPTGTYTTKEVRPATPAQTSVANSASSVTVLASNANRLGATIFNDDTAGTGATLKLKLGATASATSFTIALSPQDYFEVPFGYTGIIDGIASAGTGNARVTELTA